MSAISEVYMKLNRAVGKNEKLERAVGKNKKLERAVAKNEKLESFSNLRMNFPTSLFSISFRTF